MAIDDFLLAPIRAGVPKFVDAARSMLYSMVAPTGVDPVTSRFSVTSGAIPHCIYVLGMLLIRYFSEWSQLVAANSRGGNGPEMAHVLGRTSRRSLSTQACR